MERGSHPHSSVPPTSLPGNPSPPPPTPTRPPQLLQPPNLPQPFSTGYLSILIGVRATAEGLILEVATAERLIWNAQTFYNCGLLIMKHLCSDVTDCECSKMSPICVQNGTFVPDVMASMLSLVQPEQSPCDPCRTQAASLTASRLYQSLGNGGLGAGLQVGHDPQLWGLGIFRI